MMLIIRYLNLISVQSWTYLEVTSKANVTHSLMFSRASSRLQVFNSSFDWFTRLSVSFVIGHNDNFGFGFPTLY